MHPTSSSSSTVADEAIAVTLSQRFRRSRRQWALDNSSTTYTETQVSPGDSKPHFIRERTTKIPDPRLCSIARKQARATLARTTRPSLPPSLRL
ncbi:hypothetical protein FGO68_gene288 [Halteria grandinella]|uniref:Uncharacterized protein n=1 Tax=Halteria grandinella TaxID=5974 RepID=A0A8J8NHU4_HALGN|nr:hypothetical protein FGO68_gene288 [Halteria grandinella]